MGRLKKLFVAGLIAVCGLTAAARTDYSMWLTTEGAGVVVSGGDSPIYPVPVYYHQHRPHRHFHKRELKRQKKAYKKYRKAMKKWRKEQEKYYERRAGHHYRHHHHDD